jgi:hypothetical protein
MSKNFCGSSVTWIHSTSSQYKYLRSVLILSLHQCLGLLNSLRCVQIATPISFPWFDSPNNIRRGMKIMMLCIMKADHSPPSSAEFKNERSSTATSYVDLHDLYRGNFKFHQIEITNWIYDFVVFYKNILSTFLLMEACATCLRGVTTYTCLHFVIQLLFSTKIVPQKNSFRL